MADARTSTFTAKGGWWVVAQFILMAAVLPAGPWRGHINGSVLALVAAVLLIVAGGVVGVAGVHALAGNRTVYPMPLAETGLVQTGIYRLLRHPLYSSLVQLSFGWSLLWASWPTFVLAVALTSVLLMKARREEVFLRNKFPGYEDYARRVKRFVPGVW